MDPDMPEATCISQSELCRFVVETIGQCSSALMRCNASSAALLWRPGRSLRLHQCLLRGLVAETTPRACRFQGCGVTPASRLDSEDRYGCRKGALYRFVVETSAGVMALPPVAG